jgi:hypothetical protein
MTISTRATLAGGVSLALLAAMHLALPTTAEAIVPAVVLVSDTTLSNSATPKVAAAQCPFGTSVLGGGAVITGAEGEIAIQGGFPTYDPGLGKHLFVAKATEHHLGGTIGSWSLTAFAYCTNTTVALLQHADSAFDSDDIKSVTVECPAGMKVVGMGGEVSSSLDLPLAPLVATVPATTVVFRGVEADPDLTSVTARATEEGGVLGGATGASWKVTAVAACAWAAYFDGLELRENTERGGGSLVFETDSRVEIACSDKSMKVIATAATIDDRDLGQWYLDRFSRYNAFQHYRIVSEAYRNAALGTALVRHGVQAICVDQ